MRRLLAVALGLLGGLALFLIVDAATSRYLLRRPEDAVEWVPAAERPYAAGDRGWVQLKRNFQGRDYWGAAVYAVVTDEYGFRTGEGLALTTGPAAAIFLGDSFTYGINGAWEQTFAGMYAAASPGRVLNAGVPTYSPTPYLHAYRAALDEGAMAPSHDVFVMLDISDVHDEAGVWIDGPSHPYNLRAVNNDLNLVAEERAAMDASVRGRWRDRLRFTQAIYGLARYSLLKIPNSVVYDQPKSAFTWQPWAGLDALPGAINGFSPLGVRGGLERIRSKIAAIVSRARQAGGRVRIVIYPWPAQLRHPSHFDWPGFARDACEAAGCAGVIDTFPAFRARVAADRHWYEALFVFGDVHFSTAGNRLVFDEINRALPAASLK